MAHWANGMELTKDDAIMVLMWYFGEDMKAAELDLFTITQEKLQAAVDYYIKKQNEADGYVA